MVIVVAVALFAATAVPDVVVLAGRLSRDGVAVNGTVAAEFRVFDDDTAGNVIGAAVSDSALEVVDGVFVKEVGGLVDALADVDDAVFVEVVVDGETLQPRLKIGSVPFAAKAGAVDFADVRDVPADLLDGDDVAIQASSLVPQFPLQVFGNNLVIANGNISGDLLQDFAVRNEKLGNGAVISSKIANDAVRTEHIANNTIGIDDIGTGAVGSDELLNNSISTSKLQGGAVNRAALQAAAVSSNEVEDNSLRSDDLANNAVGTAELVDGAVTAQKIGNDAVGRAALSGFEVDVFVVNVDACEGSGMLTTSNVCRTRVCGINLGALQFFDCGGFCNQNASIGCFINTAAPAGRLLAGNGQ